LFTPYIWCVLYESYAATLSTLDHFFFHFNTKNTSFLFNTILQIACKLLQIHWSYFLRISQKKNPFFSFLPPPPMASSASYSWWNVPNTVESYQSVDKYRSIYDSDWCSMELWNMAELYSAHVDSKIRPKIHASTPNNSMAPCTDDIPPEVMKDKKK
jgi:hypothetical protein